MRISIALALGLALSGCAATDQANHSAMVRSLDDATLRRELGARFGYAPPQPLPARSEDSSAGQIADAAYFRAFPNYDRSYSSRASAQARRLAEQLSAEASALSHAQFTLRVAEIAALADNGHTALNSLTRGAPIIPVRLYLFDDGLYVVYADAAHSGLLGARIDRIDGHGVEDIYRAIRRYHGGPDSLRRQRLAPLLEAPGLLHAAGIAAASNSIVVSGVLADGTPFERRLTAQADTRVLLGPTRARLLFPDAVAGLANVLPTRTELPVSLQQSDRAFWTQPLARSGFYVRMTQNIGGAVPIEPFLEETLAQIRNQSPGFVVLDMRMNGGGNYTTTYAFARALPEAAGEAAIYVLTSPWTFSAAITTIAALKDEGGAQVIIVGEEVGDRLDFWAEGRMFVLPNTGHFVGYSTGRHVYDGPCNDLEQCFWLNYVYPVRVRTLHPDIAAPWTFAAYRDGRDPALEAVLAREARAGSTAHRR